MRLTTPRVVPPAAESWTEEQREIVEPMLARGPILNIFRTLLTHPPAAKAFLVWGGYILGRKSTLPPREREIVIFAPASSAAPAMNGPSMCRSPSCRPDR